MRQFLFSKAGLITFGFLAVAGYFLWVEHQAHLFAFLPWLLVAGCLVMHLFMHHGHDSHHNSDKRSDGDGPTNGGAS